MTNFFVSNSQIQLEISSLGAELQSLKKGDRDYLYQKTPGFWQRQSPVLFPIVGALKHGKYISGSDEYSMSQHGFARDMESKQISFIEGQSIAFILISNESTRVKYPFDFELVVTYTLKESILEVQYEVRNIGGCDMFFSLGGHPAFSLEQDVSSYALNFPEDNTLIIDRLADGLFSGENVELLLENQQLPLSDKLFTQDALIFRSINSQKVTLYKDNEAIFSFDRGNFSHFALWKQVGAPFLCLEPWQGYADSHDASGKIEKKEGIVRIASGERKIFQWSVEIY